MTWFLVESYTPASGRLSEIETRIDQSLRAVGDADIAHLVSILLAEDETCFHIFDAETREVVDRVSAMAGLAPLRIVETEHSERWG